MGPRKGGKAFLKSARAARAQPDEQDVAQEPVDDAAPAQAAADPAPPSQQPAYSSKAAAFLKDEPKTHSSSGDDDGEPGAETRGKMLQRHKRVRGPPLLARNVASCAALLGKASPAVWGDQ